MSLRRAVGWISPLFADQRVSRLVSMLRLSEGRPVLMLCLSEGRPVYTALSYHHGLVLVTGKNLAPTKDR